MPNDKPGSPKERGIQWSEIRKPGQGNGPGYDHVVADTPLGPVTIEWKGWKEPFEVYTCELPWPDAEFIAEDTLIEAMIEVDEAFEAKTAELVALLTPAQPEREEDGAP